jgi:N-acetyl-alpha-D-glucosaminyl L-malate synthase BshA
MGGGRTFRVGITCYPSVGGSGILASALGEELARRGHEVHFISYDRPFRLPAGAPRIHFHPVVINDYELFRYPDYTLPLSVKMAEVAQEHALDLLHVHYAVPHATAAILAQAMSAPGREPRVVTTLHGTDTTLLGRDAGYGPAIRHALARSDAVTAVSAWLREETIHLLGVKRPIEVVPNFFTPRPPGRSRAEVRAELGVGESPLVVHVSNLRPVKRIDLLLSTVARALVGRDFRLLVLAGGDFRPFAEQARGLGILDRVVVRENVFEVEDYVGAADVGLFTSDSESFCLGILEAMFLGVPSVSTAVGGVPEVVADESTGLLAPAGDVDALAVKLGRLLDDAQARRAMAGAAQRRADQLFSAKAVVPRYEDLYARVLKGPSNPAAQ